MDCKISYRKLRIAIMDKKISPSFICKEVGISHSIGTKIKEDKNIELFSLCKICIYLGISLDDAVDFYKE
jgi:DNA-binding Xre family transcriptional regulator